MVKMTSSDHDDTSGMTPSQPATRFVAWTALTMASAVSLGAHVSTLGIAEDRDVKVRESDEKWVTAVTAISLAIAVFAMAAHFVLHHFGLQDMFVGKPTEMYTAGALIIFWSIGLPIVMNPENFLAVGRARALGVNSFVIVNANLYFASWMAFVCLIYIFGNLLSIILGTIDYSKIPVKGTKWFALTCSSLIVLGAASRYQAIYCDDGSDTCKRNKFGICVGVFGFLLGIVGIGMIVLKRLILSIEMSLSFFLLVFYSFGVGFLTFGNGPSTFVGNYYFSSWACLLIILSIFAECIQEFLAYRAIAGSSDPGAAATAGTPMDNDPEIVESNMELPPATSTSPVSTPAPAPNLDDINAETVENL